MNRRPATENPRAAMPCDFLDQRDGIEHHAVADHAALARRAGCRRAPGAARSFSSPTSTVWPALLPPWQRTTTVRALGEHVDDLAFAFIAPLGADQDGVGHGRSSGKSQYPKFNIQHPAGQGDRRKGPVPPCGNIFSMAWKNREKFFHGVEKSAAFFHRVENFFSTAWKTLVRRRGAHPPPRPALALIPKLHNTPGTIRRSGRCRSSMRGGGGEAHVALQVLDVGAGGGHVAGLHRQIAADGLFAERLFEEGDEPVEFDRGVVADVVDAVGRGAGAGIGPGGVPRRVGRRDAVGGAVKQEKMAIILTGLLLLYQQRRVHFWLFAQPVKETGEIGILSISLCEEDTDGGKTWEAMKLLVSKDSLPCDNATPIADFQTGEVHMLYQTDYAQCYYIKSVDDGKSWSDPVEITATIDTFKKVYP